MTVAVLQAWLSTATQFAVLVGVVVGIGLQIRVATRLRQTQADVHRVEVATNSMKDALIVATDKASGLAGEKRGREAAAREMNPAKG